MITNSEEGWTLFNNLMNQLREAIVTKSLSILGPYSVLILDKSIPLAKDNTSKIVGIYRELNEISITIEDIHGEHEYEVYNSKFDADDFLHLLKQLEDANIDAQTE